MEIHRKRTKAIKVGNVMIGGGNPIVVQSMLKTNPENVEGSLNQLRELKRAGCEIVRIALPTEESLNLIPFFKKEVNIPIVGDVHFHIKIAQRAMEMGIDCIRINPGTINNVRKVKEVAKFALETKTPIRIGINSGSVERRVLKKYGRPTSDAMVESALYYTKLFEDVGWTEIKVSLKGSDVLETVDAYRKFASQTNYPLHVGITEAGPIFSGAIKSAIGIGILLSEGIGDTIRVSLTAHPVYEVIAAYRILASLNLRKRGLNIIACPMCGRCKVDLKGIVDEFERQTVHIEKPLKVAIMGCEVNGPGEAKDADIGIAFGAKSAVIFARGIVIRRNVPHELAREILEEELYRLL
ncbi:MAG: flavodoxin-dependent (E)-4-hydroxy-3-methylbut-2-enyl-diphosphate synthase [Desulfobacterota bacterium]|nr:flavodoxin-dependent (E)-4-hydroxy-3-methylbut-2-enyl-diphosphate synthase [Thermodesulfobacteriota bacterium]MDW8002032.1 flavodoxin-dependent (E)-4-hydroxy-3-methylbut-2-enyl-diphosphate synthase [Deltaproteobacteria bacterium]